MRHLLTGDDLYNHLMMQRVVDQRTFLILEGDTDCQALDPHLDDGACVSFPAHSKSALKAAVLLADGNAFEGVLAIMDRDFVDVLEPRVTSSNVVYTSDYDLDATMMFAGDVMERVASAYSDRLVRTEYLQWHGLTLEEAVVGLAVDLGLARFVSVRDRLGFRCEKFPIHETARVEHCKIDRTKLAMILESRSPNATTTAVSLVSVVEREVASVHDPRWYCAGHDLAASLATLVNHWGGAASRGALERAIRAAFSAIDLRQTRLYVAVRDWALRNGAVVWSVS